MTDQSRTLYVWDLFIRIFHWSLVITFITAWFSSKITDEFHNFFGYLAGTLVALRLIWGVIGSRYARFAEFVRSPRRVLAYVQDIIKGREARYIGHNPAGAAMIILLLLGLCLSVFSGWLQTTDSYYGIEWVEQLHRYSVHAMLVLIVGHLAGVLLASVRHRENLVKAMITGRKRA